MDFRYARLAPHPPSDPHQPVPPPPGTWYPGTYSPSPPPPQWASQSQHSEHHLPPPPPYAAAPPPPMPYASNNPYSLPPRPHMQPPPPQSHYHPANQEWSNTIWGHQGWDYSVHHKIEDDWAARARAWAASKSVTDEQHHPQSVPDSRPVETTHQDQYSQNMGPSYTEFQQHALPSSSYQQYPSSFAPPPRMPSNHLQEPPSFSSGYASVGHFSYTDRDGNSWDSTAAYLHQETAPTSLSVHQQEVPSSYSSVAGKEESREMNGKFYQPSHMPFTSTSQQQVQPQISPDDGSIPVEQPRYSFSNPSAEPTTDLSNQPLDFGPGFGHDHDPFGQSKYEHESGGPMGAISTATSMASFNSWPSSAAPGIPYPPMAPVHPTGQQTDPSLGVPSPASMHSAPLFGRMTSANTTFPIGTSNVFHATNAFPGETYGTPGFPDRPKKASMPNWLREEIIKKKAAIVSAAPDFSRQDTETNEDEVIDQYIGKGDPVDGKSMESSRSTEEEDVDEDYVEVARTAAINQEIKRILTEVLLKVTDELFDEIATKVLEEDDLTVEVEHKAIASSDTISAPSPAVPTPKPSAKVLIPAKTKGTNSDDASGRSSSSSPEDVLGLGNYASDDDDDDKEVQNSLIPSSRSSKRTEHPTENGSSPFEENDNHGTNDAKAKHGEEYHSDTHGGEKGPDNSDVSKSRKSVGDKGVAKNEPLIEGVNAKKALPDTSRSRSPRNESDKGGHKRSASKDYNEKVESGKDKKSKKDDQNGSNEKVKERDSSKMVNMTETKGDEKEIDRDRRSHKADGRKRERAMDEKSEWSKQKSVGDTSRHKRHHSPSPGSRGRSSKDNSSVSHAYASTDTSSDDSRRKLHSKRRELSPSPARSRRQVSRSPSSKRSHRRHSMYSSVETTRERKRSRSRSRRG